MKLVPKPSYCRKLKQGGFTNLFAEYTIAPSPSFVRRKQVEPEEDDYLYNYSFVTTPRVPTTYESPPEFADDSEDYNYYYDVGYPEEEEEFIPPQVIGNFNSSELLSIDIEDLLRSEGITSINGKKIKFGNKNLRPANASYGVKNSNHKRRDPQTGWALARDISIVGGTTADYAEFRRVLLSNPKVVAWMQAKNWGIINELTPAVLRRTRGTGPHFHFGPDRWARKVWGAWTNNPNLPVTQVI